MRNLNMKPLMWDGKNKAVVRTIKEKLILKHSKKSGNLLMLSFPGAKAHMEKSLFSKGVSNESIVGIQTLRVTPEVDGKDVVASLVGELHRNKTPIALFTGDFINFPRALAKKVFPRDKDIPAPFRMGSWRGARKNLKFNVLELDLCAPFGRGSLIPLEEMFSRGMIADDTLLIVNHLKGREQPKALLKFLAESHKRLGSIRASLPKTIGGTWFRYKYIPNYYQGLAETYGFSCTPKLVFEYRDLGQGAAASVNMIQYVFSVKKSTARSFPAYRAAATRATRTLYKEASSVGTAKKFSGTLYRKSLD